MRYSKPASLLLALAFAIPPAFPLPVLAQDGANDRYTLEKSERGFVRLAWLCGRR